MKRSMPCALLGRHRSRLGDMEAENEYFTIQASEAAEALKLEGTDH